jgi:hypothetical protein
MRICFSAAAAVAAMACLAGCKGAAVNKRGHYAHKEGQKSLFDNTAASERSKICVCPDGKGMKACAEEAGPLACAEIARDHGGSGWAELRISTFARDSATIESVAEAAGFAEGMLTAPEITELRARFAGGSVRSQEDQQTVLEFAKQQWPSVEHASATAMSRMKAGKPAEGEGVTPAIGKALAAKSNAYWTAVAIAVHQVRGMARGYRHAHNAAASSAGDDEAEDFLEQASSVWGSVSEEDAFWAIVSLNYDVDAFDITDAEAGGGGFGPSGAAEDGGSDGAGTADLGGGRFAAAHGRLSAEQSAALSEREEAAFSAESWAKRSSRGRCTAAIVASQACLNGGGADSKCDVFSTHATWGHYGEALRVYKTVDWAGVGKALGSGPSHLSYSSYPGMVSSTDDWLVLGSGILVTETTIGAADASAIGRLTTSTQEFVPAGAGASATATAGAELLPLPAFVRSMVASLTASSGAEWARLFAARNGGTSNSQWLVVDYNSLRSPSRKGLLWVLEQSPKRVIAADATGVFLGKAAGLWPGTNRPLFGPIRDDLAYPGEVGLGPLVRAAASAMGVRVQPPAGVSGGGEEAETWGMEGLWEVRIGTRESDAAQPDAAREQSRFSQAKAKAKHARHHSHPASKAKEAADDASSLLWDGSESDIGLDLDSTTLSRFRQLSATAASAGSAATAEASSLRGGMSDTPWLELGRQRHRHRPSSGYAGQKALSPAGIRFAAVTSTVAASSTSEYALARQSATRTQLHRALAASSSSEHRGGSASSHGTPEDTSASGYDRDSSSGVGYYSFDANPRASQLHAFARSATSLDSALRLSRMNGWPLVQATHHRPYFAPAARFDLAAQSDSSLQPFGAIDGKAVSAASVAAGQAKIVGGPSRGFGWRSAQGLAASPQSDLLQAFDWRTFGSQGVCGQETNPAMLDGDTVLSGNGAGDRKCACGPDWTMTALQLPCGMGLEEEQSPSSTLVPRAVTVGGTAAH